jgi:hypothetical protein
MSRFSLRRSPEPVVELERPAPEPVAAAAPVFKAPAPEPASAPAAPPRNEMLDVKLRLHTKLIEELDLAKLDRLERGEMRTQVRNLVGDFVRAEKLAFNTAELEALGDSVFDEMVGLGPIEPLLKDDSISDILINGPFQIYIERRGELEIAPVRFRDNDHLLRIVNRIAAGVGRGSTRARPWWTPACRTAAGSTPPSGRSPSTAPPSPSEVRQEEADAGAAGRGRRPAGLRGGVPARRLQVAGLHRDSLADGFYSHLHRLSPRIPSNA